ncbi:MAG: glycoside hydrolase family 15 protein [Acidobacteriaceae bacterium]
MSLKIEDYALIGDCHTAALVGRNGSIDWLCWPDFASGACFSSILGDESNGYWSIRPAVKRYKSSRRYIPHTLILETTFETRKGAVRVIDFMPTRDENSDVVRIVEGIRGEVEMQMELAIRCDYGHTVPWVVRTDEGVRAIAGPHLMFLRASEETHGEDLKTVSTFSLRRGQRAWFTLTHGLSHKGDPPATDALEALAKTTKFWVDWTKKSRRRGKYAEVIERSLITLKALTYMPTGGVVAAPTTSLPEQLGGPRNWDYRYCWLRDATFTLLALMSGGYYEEARAWQDWLLRALAGSADQVQIMYGIHGERSLVEWEADWLPGYENSKPVRIGNAAAEQLQLDIYGEVMDAFFHAEVGVRSLREEDFHIWRELIEHLRGIWMLPDEGIWETRGEPEHFTYSKVMAWLAFDRAIQLAEHHKLDVPMEAWKRTRDEIHEEVCKKGFDKRKNSFVQSYETKRLDAALLLIPLVGFLPVDDPRVIGTVDAVQKYLMKDGLVLRYDTAKGSDGLPPGEGAFLACSFWLVSALHAIGRKGEAKKLFDRLLKLTNDVGLLAEEYDTKRKRQVGNFPQAFSHITLLVSALHVEGDGLSRHRQGWHSKEGKLTIRQQIAHHKAHKAEEKKMRMQRG